MRVKNPEVKRVSEVSSNDLVAAFKKMAGEYVSFDDLRGALGLDRADWSDGRVQQLLQDAGYGDLVEVG